MNHQNTPVIQFRNLGGFLEDVDKLFDNIVDCWSHILFKESDRQPVADAWAEVKSNLPTLIVAINSANNRSKLKDAGLENGSKQLELKLKGVSDAWSRFWLSGTVRLLKDLLSWINAILGSIASAIPGGEGIKELKEAIEKLIQD
ncbi:MAG TPA: hypothetical protein VFE62_01300 [Gemmataceae bacterium]|nr:hypothetical protein [Gemmataceae bacterium]